MQDNLGWLHSYRPEHLDAAVLALKELRGRRKVEEILLQFPGSVAFVNGYLRCSAIESLQIHVYTPSRTRDFQGKRTS